ncbi:RES family NAD+ phosphorylase [Pedobacter cryophilus]|uniref:RES domain-containing protein n=1 Tax=Pedobacter cryophilus TaxID=2571271 RepID=A0A4U1BSX2_9SPHI|nr:RES family NAD+ phosphorylase [Pedobacter cryophilus]TKB95242.1 RES domain-containing protein [Pedobacter cryophilus]
MLVYRIAQTKYAGSLASSGFAGRWNTEGEGMIYTGGSAALSCLEVLAHKSGAALNSGKFSMAVISIPDDLLVSEITLSQLQEVNTEWFKVLHYPLTQKLGNKWVLEMKSAVLKVPSAIVDREYNYLLNPLHPKFSKIKVLDITPFNFDQRLKLNIT